MEHILRAGVAGAGVFGGYHANKYGEVDGAALTAIFDVDPSRAADAAAARGVNGFSDYDAFLTEVDVLTIATPATTHGALALRALSAGKHVLVEKPIAMDVATANAMIDAASAARCVLQVGHQERYVADAFGLLSRPVPRHVRSRRMNKFSGRAMDVSVVFDLMIHDLDLLAQFVCIEGASITAVTARRVHGNQLDFVSVDLQFGNGTTASLAASRIEIAPLRDLLMSFDDGDVGLDFLGRHIRNTTATPLPVVFDAEEKPAALADPLRYGTQRFVDAVRTQTSPPVTGADGRAALGLALMIEEAAISSVE